MTIYGGFDPATFQAWALNLFADIFITPGIARGFQVTQTGLPSMAVLVNLDSVANDAVCYFSSGAWLRVDAITQFSISSNTSGATRTDALVAQVDPLNAGNLSLSIQANWSQGFNPTNPNQLVIALISVANNAVNILNANITMTSQTAKVTGAGGSTSSMVASDGVGLAVQDNSASSALSVVLTGLTTGVGRAIIIQPTDSSGIGHAFTFGADSNFYALGTGGYIGSNQEQATGFSLYSTGGDTWLGGGARPIKINTAGTIYLSNNNYWDTVSDKFINGAGQATQYVFTNGANARLAWRYSLNAAAAGATINWSAYNYFPAMANNGGAAAGTTIWQGGNDPGGLAVEGDLWAAG